jgi:hypothetical protein
MGIAVPHRIGRHVHPDARPDLPPPATATGIDYLALVSAQHRAELAVRINYTDLPTTAGVDRDTNDTNDTDGQDHDALEAELASFALLRTELASGELRGQLDLTDLTDDDSEGPRR